MASEIPKNNHLGWTKKLVRNHGRNNMDKLPTSTGEFMQIFWTMNRCRPTCTWQLKGSVTVGKDRCGALTNTGTCIHEVLGGGDIEDIPVCEVDIYGMTASVDGRLFCWRNMWFQDVIMCFWVEELHINRCMSPVTFQSFRNCSYKLDPRVYGMSFLDSL